MAEHALEKLDESRVKLTVTIPSMEARPFLEEAAARLSEKTTIPGFRPGHAGYDVVKQRLGAMKILEEAIEPMIRKTFVAAVLEQQLETVGSPKIDLEKMVPENDIVYTAEVSLMPEVTKLADFRKLSIKAEPFEVTDADIDLALKDLQRMQTRETPAEGGSVVTDRDKVVLSMEMKKDGVPVEGGSSANHAVYMQEDYYVPGLKEQLLGMKAGEEKTFFLPFPKDHVQKMLAGSDIHFTVQVKEIHRLALPEFDDEFAKSLGQEGMPALREILRTNLAKDKQEEETFRQEKALLELLAEKSRFGNIPDLLLNEEINKMANELRHRVEEQGLEFEKYLEGIKKTIANLKMDFTPQAIMRIKVALLLRAVAKQENITIDEKEIEAALDRAAAEHEEPEVRKQIYSPVYREYMETTLRNRKVLELLKEAMVK